MSIGSEAVRGAALDNTVQRADECPFSHTTHFNVPTVISAYFLKVRKTDPDRAGHINI